MNNRKAAQTFILKAPVQCIAMGAYKTIELVLNVGLKVVKMLKRGKSSVEDHVYNSFRLTHSHSEVFPAFNITNRLRWLFFSRLGCSKSWNLSLSYVALSA